MTIILKIQFFVPIQLKNLYICIIQQKTVCHHEY